jgi:tricorn protease
MPGDLWIADSRGRRRPAADHRVGTETDPQFSPDGTQIAFTGEYDGNVDVYVVPAAGGVPRRLTYHPGYDGLKGWTPDGKRVLFSSGRNSYSWTSRLFTLPVEGGTLPDAVPLPMAEEGSYAPDGARLAYVPLARAFQSWKRYRGGRATPIWIATLSDSRIEKIPRKDSNDFNPMWVGDTVYFLSDRNGPVTLFSYDTGAKKVTQVLKNQGLDLKAASAGAGAIAYERFGAIHLYDLKTGQAKRVDIRVNGDLPELRPRFEKITGSALRGGGLSPAGARVVFEARGEIFTVPAKKGDPRNLTNTPGVAERDPAWSPDGKTIAYFSDESGEYALHLRDQTGRGEVRKISLGSPPSFFYAPRWSPDSKKIALFDRRLELSIVDVAAAAGTALPPPRRRVDTALFDSLNFAQVWSPDGRWLAYTRRLPNKMSAVFVHDTTTGKNHQITDGMSDAVSPDWDKGGKYLYFLASTDVGPTLGFIDMSGRFNRPVTRSAYVVVLRNDLPSPLAPESDEEKASAAADTPPDPARDTVPAEKATSGDTGAGGDTPGDKKDADEKKASPPAPVRIDLDGIDQRVLALPIPPRNYTGLAAGKDGAVFVAESPAVAVPGAPGRTLHKFDLATRKNEKFLENVNGFTISQDREKMLVSQGAQTPRLSIVSTAKPPSGGDDTSVLNLDGLEVRVDPQAEWRQMFREVWRIERDFFYDPNYHGLNLAAAEKRYAPYLDGLASRADLNYLFSEMLGELSVGHLYVGGGSSPEVRRVRGGLLGADFTIENGRYRFARVYGGENWNPDLRAPLTQPGVNVRAGEYLLEVNGRDVRAADNLYRFLENTADKQVVLKVGPNPSPAAAREVTVVPVESEVALRNLAWIEENRRKVARMTNNRVAYVYLPDTGGGGYTPSTATSTPRRTARAWSWTSASTAGARRPITSLTPCAARSSTTGAHATGRTSPPRAWPLRPQGDDHHEYAGSGGDAMPWYFRKMGIGPLIGKRTWGGLVGIGGYPTLLDGARSPRRTSPSGTRTAGGTWKTGRRPRHRGGVRPAGVAAGPRPAARKGGRRRDGGTGQKAAAPAQKARIPQLPSPDNGGRDHRGGSPAGREVARAAPHHL